MSEQEQHEELKKAISVMGDKINLRLLKLEGKVEPIHDMFKSVQGFNKISIWLLKLLASIGAALLGFYALIEFFKKLSK